MIRLTTSWVGIESLPGSTVVREELAFQHVRRVLEHRGSLVAAYDELLAVTLHLASEQGELKTYLTPHLSLLAKDGSVVVELELPGFRVYFEDQNYHRLVDEGAQTAREVARRLAEECGLPFVEARPQVAFNRLRS